MNVWNEDERRHYLTEAKRRLAPMDTSALSELLRAHEARVEADRKLSSLPRVTKTQIVSALSLLALLQPHFMVSRLGASSELRTDRLRSFLAMKTPMFGCSLPAWLDMLDAIECLHHVQSLVETPTERRLRAFARTSNLGLYLPMVRLHILMQDVRDTDAVELLQMYFDDLHLLRRAAYEDWIPQVQTHAKGLSLDWLMGQGIRDFERGTVFFVEDAIAKYRRALQESTFDCVFLAGPSGLGKSTFSTELCRKLGRHYEVISLDEVRRDLTGSDSDQSMNGEVLQYAKERLREACRQRRHLIWDATNLRRDFRAPLIELARNYGALTTMIMFVAPIETAQTMNSKRDRQVPRQVIQRQYDALEFPHVREADRVLYVGEQQTILKRAGFYGEREFPLAA